ncbi:MAG: nitrogenase cofactor biosynthesis protein NifB [Rhodospirillaceae bacterium]|nr:nitrogenase cofactor biosynthesis protein NifB [Rhodospirillaceae bacterium]
MTDAVVTLSTLQVGKGRNSLATTLEQRSGSGCTKSSCGAAAGPGDLPPEVWEKIKDHPCYSEEAHHYFARMHVAVAPACNIQCNYCNRKYDCANESRPGVVSERLAPEDAVRKVLAVAAEVPELSVLGIAGPGDACYDWRRTKATFQEVSARLPDLKLCISTNGLALPDHVEELAAMNVDHVTITINMIDPEIGTKIYPWIFFQGRRHTGIEASRILHERQMQSLEMLAERNILVKVNSVLIPGINDQHLVEVNRAVKARGAFLHNIMPLISAPEHGTVFGLSGQRGPTAAELEAVQEACAGGANLMRHCRQCRADAIGLLGEDRGQEFTLDKLPEEAAVDDAARRRYRAWVDAERSDRRAAAEAAEADMADSVAVDAPRLLVAVCTKSGGRINQHFGHAKEFQVFEVDAAGVRFVGHRRADNYCLGGYGDEDRMAGVLEALAGIDTVLCAKIGSRPRQTLADAGIEAIDDHAYEYAETAVAAVYAARFGTVAAPALRA